MLHFKILIVITINQCVKNMPLLLILKIIIKSTEPCTKAKLGDFSKIDADIDCLTDLKNSKFLWRAMKHAFEFSIIFWYDFFRFSRKKSDIWGYFILTHTVYVMIIQVHYMGKMVMPYNLQLLINGFRFLISSSL